MPYTPGLWKIAGATHVYASGPNGANICSISEPRAEFDKAWSVGRTSDAERRLRIKERRGEGQFGAGA